LEEILKNIDYIVLNRGENNIKYVNIEYDSRLVKKNGIFIALDGFKLDGHNYIESAIKNGAKCILVSKDVPIIDKSITYIKIENLRYKLGKIGLNYYGELLDKINLIGITGTNGKTTSTYIIEHILGESSRIGTIEYKVGDEIIEAKNTTPESLDIVKLINKTVCKNIKNMVMEVSSHALELGRVDMLAYDTVIFTNLTQDHLDYHKDMENYYTAKKKLFKLLKKGQKGVINIDDHWGKRLHEELGENIITVGIESKCDIGGKILNYTNHNMSIQINYNNRSYELDVELMGKFNLYNILGSVGAAVALGYEISYIVDRLKTVKKVPGRFETINIGQNFMAVVDYAHTEDGLINILESISEFKKNKIITVFGAGGDRDKTKRPKMAIAAAKYSDYVIVTNDNSRTEDPKIIADEVIEGFKNIGYTNYKVIIDREEAIKYAISLTEKNDILLVAGKGHETYQIIGNEKFHFDDREIIKKYID